jgi:cytochrome c553
MRIRYKSWVFAFLFGFCLIHPLYAVPIGKEVLKRCAQCHGADGNAQALPSYPKLAGQNQVYFLRSLAAFRAQARFQRKNPVMQAIVQPLSPAECMQFAAYYAALPTSIDSAQADQVPLGERLYRGGDLGKGLPACLACHGPAGLGNPPAGFPRLSGQHAAYVAAQLKAFRSGERQDRWQMMTRLTQKMTDEEINAVAQYVSGLYF